MSIFRINFVGCVTFFWYIQEVLRDFPADGRHEPKKRVQRRMSAAGNESIVCICVSLHFVGTTAASLVWHC